MNEVWNPINTFPKDRVFLLKTTIGVVSAQYFGSVPPECNDPYGDSGEGPCLSCYDDYFQLDVEEGPEGQVYVSTALGWMEIPDPSLTELLKKSIQLEKGENK